MNLIYIFNGIRKAAFMLIVITGLTVVSPAGATIYYVDGSLGGDCTTGNYSIANRACDGSDGNGYNHIADVNPILVAGDTAYIRGGTGTYETMYIGAIDSSTEGIHPDNSGSPGMPITYAVYTDEKIHFIGDNNDALRYGIVFDPADYIRVIGHDGTTSSKNMKFSNFTYFLRIWDGDVSWPYGDGSSYNEISHCEFIQTNDIFVDLNPGSAASRIEHNSDHNWVHHCTIGKMGGNKAADIASSLDIGWEDCGISAGAGEICDDDSNHNVIEDNEFYHAGHHTLLILNNKNVARRNVFHNEQWYHYTSGDGGDDIWYGYRVIQGSGTYNSDDHHGYNLVEDNRISHGTNNYNNSKGGAGYHLGAANTIVRGNDFYANAGNAIVIENHLQAPTLARIDHNHIYNNTFFANGFGATFPNADFPLDGNNARGHWDRNNITIYSSEANFPLYYNGNVIKNNLFYNNYNASVGREPWATSVVSDYTFDNCAGYTVCGDTVIAGNYTDASGDPQFVSVGSYGSPAVESDDVEWYWGASTPDGTDITTINTEPNLALQSSSEAINQGTYLTQAIGSGRSTTTLVVDDAGYFQDGWGDGAGGGAVVNADWIAIDTVSNVVAILSIDYGTNTITLAAPMTWADNANVWLYRNSTGTVVLHGMAPDPGAHEFSDDTGTPPTISGIVDQEAVISTVFSFDLSEYVTEPDGDEITYALDAGSDPLPDGLTLAANGTLSGTPTEACTRNIAIRVIDKDGQASENHTDTFEITVSAGGSTNGGGSSGSGSGCYIRTITEGTH